MKALLLASSILFTGCASLQANGESTREAQIGAILSGWVGKMSGDLVFSWGQPDRVWNTEGGGNIYIYKVYNTQTTGQGLTILSSLAAALTKQQNSENYTRTKTSVTTYFFKISPDNKVIDARCDGNNPPKLPPKAPN